MKKEIDAIIISDLHLGSDACQSKFLRKFLEKIEKSNVKKIIINGDMFDSLNFKRLKKTHWKILGDFRKLSKNIEIIFNIGNHDGNAENISHLIGAIVNEEYVLNSGNKKILIMHGHVFDDFISNHPMITAVADFFYTLLQKIDPNKHIARLAKRASKTYLRNAEIIKKRAVDYAKKNNYDIVCLGHSHHEEDTEIYKNSGCWTESICSYLEVENGNVTLKHFVCEN